MSLSAAGLTVRRCAKPISLKNGNRRVVLAIHGYTGYPGELAYPAQRLFKAGWDVYVPRLTGHGSAGRDFEHARPRHWMRQVRDAWMDMCVLYDRVVVLGHSMGGLLALWLATVHRVDALALMAPAIGMRVRGRKFLPLMALLRKKSPRTWERDSRYEFFDDRDAEDDAYLGREYWSWTWYKPLAGIFRLQKHCERRLNRISAPILAVFAADDPLIGTKGSELLAAGLRCPHRIITLEDCGHHIPYDPNPGKKETAMDAVIAWFEDNGQE